MNYNERGGKIRSVQSTVSMRVLTGSMTQRRVIPDVTVKQFAAEARSLDVASMHDCAEPKRLTLATALVLVQMARALDDVADMYIRLVQRLHNHAYTSLRERHIGRWNAPMR